MLGRIVQVKCTLTPTLSGPEARHSTTCVSRPPTLMSAGNNLPQWGHLGGPLPPKRDLFGEERNQESTCDRHAQVLLPAHNPQICLRVTATRNTTRRRKKSPRVASPVLLLILLRFESCLAIPKALSTPFEKWWRHCACLEECGEGPKGGPFSTPFYAFFARSMKMELVQFSCRRIWERVKIAYLETQFMYEMGRDGRKLAKNTEKKLLAAFNLLYFFSAFEPISKR